MFKSQIQSIYHECDFIRTNPNSNAYKKEFDELIRCNNAMRKRIGDDKELEKLFEDFEKALNFLNCSEAEDIFKKGFIMGAQMTLEVCGVKCDED